MRSLARIRENLSYANHDRSMWTTSNQSSFQETLTVEDHPKRRPPPPPPSQPNGASARPENVPPKPKGPPPYHAPSASEEERRRLGGKPRGPPGELNIFADPSDKQRDRRPRRNSDTSIRERSQKLLDPNDDRRRRERRHRDSRRDGKSKGPNRRLDVIDKLDVTSIYGTGREFSMLLMSGNVLILVVFHHDGPFDACNPHRNRKGSRQAPMQAFPKDSRNMAIGGSGPNNSNIDLNQFHGRGEEGYNDYSTSAVVDDYPDNIRRPNPGRSASFHPITRVEPLHGEESMGLGTSTFLEGAPASRTAIQRKESDYEDVVANPGAGLGRKKSLAMKIRGMSNNRVATGRTTSPESDKAATPTTPLGTGQSVPDTNPFFKDYDKEYEKKGAQIVFAEDKTGRARAPSSPRRGLGLERKTTIESIGEEPKSAGGFLSRVKSLKGGRRTVRGEKRDAS
jgi:Pal1 cell morphology protein